jgi:hypothetical protein
MVPAEFSGTTLELLWRDLERGDLAGAAVEVSVLAICVGLIAWTAIRWIKKANRGK